MSLPHRLGRLRRISRIGSGGFATVWLYSDPDLQSQVAVKALADNWATRTDIRERFLEEARILRRADSDHVVRVYDLGETDDGTPYFVMNYADRGTVADLLNAPSRDLPAIADLVAQACDGLRRLHTMGILHRDVKPQNLLLSGEHSGATRLMIADLGVAKAMLHASGITQVVGTPAYMAPEQADPTRAVDVRCDVHAMGAVTYHLVTGRPMRTGGVESLFAPESIRPPSSLVPDLPSALDQVVMRAVAYDPEQRWPDIASFAAAFQNAVSTTKMLSYAPPRVEAQVWQPRRPVPEQQTPDSPVPQSPVPPPPVPSRTPVAPEVRRTRRRRNVWAVCAAVALVAVVLAGTIAWQNVGGGGPDESTGPDLELGSGWAGPVSGGEDATWRYSNGSDDLELVVNTEPGDGSVEQAAQEYASTIEDDEFSVDGSEALDDEQRDKWETGWELRYSGENNDGATVYYRRWYFGNAEPQTAGWVEVRGLEQKLTRNDDAVELLSRARDKAVIGID